MNPLYLTGTYGYRAGGVTWLLAQRLVKDREERLSRKVRENVAVTYGAKDSELC